MEYTDSDNNGEEGSLIYIIDDCGLQKLLLKKTLNQRGFRVRAFTNGFNLIKALDEECPDLIISDIDMPNIDGMDLIREVKSRQNCNDIPFWFLSSFDITDVKEKARNLGAEKFINKPFNDKELIADVRSRLQSLPDVAGSMA
ncbi:MAG: response regulator [Balneolaceae bacterium]|nr:response regulator [Balneolaceae bacterium]